jgi:hypothetical protein
MLLGNNYGVRIIMKKGIVLCSLLLVICFIVLAIGGYHWFDNLTNIHFQGYIGVASQPVYVFSEKQIDSILSTYKDSPILTNKDYLPQITNNATYQKLHGKLIKSDDFFSQVSTKTAIAETKTEPLCGSFYWSFPRRNLPKNDNLVFVGDRLGNLWFRLVLIPEDVRSSQVDLDNTKIVHNKITHNNITK